MLRRATLALAAVAALGAATDAMARGGRGLGGGLQPYNSTPGSYGGVKPALGPNGGLPGYIPSGGGFGGVKPGGFMPVPNGGLPGYGPPGGGVGGVKPGGTMPWPNAGLPGYGPPGGGPKPRPPHHHHHWGRGFVSGAAGYSAALVVPASEECFLEWRRVHGIVRQVRVCADPYR